MLSFMHLDDTGRESSDEVCGKQSVPLRGGSWRRFAARNARPMIRDRGLRWLLTILAILVGIAAIVALAFLLIPTPGVSPA
jgi:hypothetical protein